MGKARGKFASSFSSELAPRIMKFAQQHDGTDVDSVVEYLRNNFDQYTRQKLKPFRKAVAQIVEELASAAKRKEDMHTHVRFPSLKQSEERRKETLTLSSSSRGEETTSSGSGSMLDDAEFDTRNITDGLAPKRRKSNQALNASLVNLYSTSIKDAPNTETKGSLPAKSLETEDRAVSVCQPAERTELAGPSTAKGLQHTPNIKQPVAATAQPSQTLGAALEDNSVTPTAAAATLRPSATPPSTQVKQQLVIENCRPTPAKRQRSVTPAKRSATSSSVTRPLPLRYSDLGGIEDVLEDIREVIEYPLRHPEVYTWLGVDPPRGVLLHGPPGCGKTALANAIANECGVPFLKVSSPEIVSGMSGESEAKLRQLFQEALALAPCIVFIDEIDAIMPKRETAQREMERRIVAQMLTCLDDLGMPRATKEGEEGGEGSMDCHADERDGANATSKMLKHIVVIGATNRPDALDSALRRAGRFDREIALGIPSEAARVKILQVLARRLRLAGDFDFRLVAKRTPGFAGADLAALTKEAAALAVTRIFRSLDACAVESAQQPSDASTSTPTESSSPAAPHFVALPAMDGDVPLTGHLPVPPRLGGAPLDPQELASCVITMKDFEEAVRKVQPNIRREGFSTTPDVTWEDVGALQEVRDELSFAITQPIAHPERFEAMGLSPATGVLLFGPPGCGKTLVAKAAANDSGANFMSIKGPELLNKYVGESERAVRQLFARARAAAPCVLFFDEMDALAPRRGTDVNQAAERVVNQLLTEMDGMESRASVYIIAATNRPDMIDPALLRPGRLDKMLYIPIPSQQGRVSILKTLTRRTPLSMDVDITALACCTELEGFSGADLEALVREACVEAMKESFSSVDGLASNSPPFVCQSHFRSALFKISPSVSPADQRTYQALQHKLRSTRAHLKSQGEDDVPAGRATRE